MKRGQAALGLEGEHGLHKGPETGRRLSMRGQGLVEEARKEWHIEVRSRKLYAAGYRMCGRGFKGDQGRGCCCPLGKM